MVKAYLLSAAIFVGTLCLNAPATTLERGPYLQMVSPSAVTIRWRTDASEVGRVWFGTSPTALSGQRVETLATTEHEVRIEGLTAETRYYYAVGNAAETLAGGDAETFFRTAPEPGRARALRVWVVGDAGRANAAQRATRDAYEELTAGRETHAMVLLGDNVYEDGTDAEYQTKFFDIYPALLRQTPVWPSLGNHDTAGSTASNPDYPYHRIFTLPTAAESGGVPSGNERYYSFDLGPVHFVCLDSQTSQTGPNDPMAQWLRADLAASPARWRIAFFHHPPYSRGGNNSDQAAESIEMRTTFVPIFDQYGMDLVFAGHSHNYERSWPIAGHTGSSSTYNSAMQILPGNGDPTEDGAYTKSSTLNPPALGTIYVVAGSASSLGGGSLNHPAMAVSQNELGTVVLEIRGAHLELKFLRDDGTIGDSFTLIKPWPTADADGDGMPDAFEDAYGFGKNHAADAMSDADADGYANRAEFHAATDPRDPAHAPRLFIEEENGSVTLRFPTVAGVRYGLDTRADLSSGSWNVLADNLSGTGEELTFPVGASQRFYRLRAGP